MKKEIKDVKQVLEGTKEKELIVTKELESYIIERKNYGYQVCPSKKIALSKDKFEILLSKMKPKKSIFGYFFNGKYIITFESLFIKDFDTAVEIAVDKGVNRIYDWKRNETIKI